MRAIKVFKETLTVTIAWQRFLLQKGGTFICYRLIQLMFGVAKSGRIQLKQRNINNYSGVYCGTNGVGFLFQLLR